MPKTARFVAFGLLMLSPSILRRGIFDRAVAGALLLLTVAPAGAQDSKLDRAVAFSGPVSWMFKQVSVDYERQITRSVTLGGNLSYRRGLTATNFDGGLTSATLIVRSYPRGNALTGLYVAADTGIHRTRVALAPGLGWELGYVWRVGSERNIVLGVGAGHTLMLRPMGGLVTVLRLFDVGLGF